MDFASTLKDRVQVIEGILDAYLPPVEGPQAQVIEAMNYAVRAGGKHIRPLLMQETHKLLGGQSPALPAFMAALEFIHNYSLIHDDLPAMDNDDFRRGQPTVHKAYGEALAILAGDGLLNLAFETASQALTLDDPHKTSRAFQVLAQKAGIYGMIGGQVVDIQTEGQSIDLETLLFIHQLKCGALFEAAMEIGAILAGASAEEEKAIEAIAADLGLAFQIQDDILDVTSNLEALGKASQADAALGKNTYVSLLGLDKAKQEVSRLTDKALKQLRSLPQTNSFLESLILALCGRAY